MKTEFQPKRTIIGLAVMACLGSAPAASYATIPGEIFQVSSSTSQNADPDVAMDSDGDFVVVWKKNNGDVAGQRFDETGAPQGGEFSHGAYIGTGGGPEVATDADGDFVVVWADTMSSVADVRGQRYNADGISQGTVFVIDYYDWRNPAPASPGVAMDANGNFVVVWREPGRGVYSRQYSTDGTPLGSAFVVDDSYSGQYGENSDVAMDADGDFVVVWDGFISSTDRRLFGKRYNANGVAQGDKFVINTHTNNYYGENINFDVAMDASGGVVIVWQDEYTDNGVYGRRFNADGIPQEDEEFRIDSGTSTTTFSPRVAMDDDGDFVIAWNSYSSYDGYRSFSKRYNTDGSAAGDETIVARDHLRDLSVAMDADGDMVVAWEKNEVSTGSGDHVFARLYREQWLGDLAVSVSSENEIFRSGKNADFSVTINNPGDTQVNDATVFITHDLGFEKFLWRDLWFCGEGSESCTHISTNTDKLAGITTAEFRVSLSAKTAAFIQGRGEFEGYDGVRVVATVSGGTPSDPNPENNAASKVISTVPGELPGTQDVYLCDGPGSCECYGLGCGDTSSTLNIVTTKPTVVLTHGLQNSSCAQGDLWTDFRESPVGAGKLLNDAENTAVPAASDVNVLQYFWKGACHGIGGPNRDAYIKGRQNVYHAGEELAKILKEKLGTDYSQKIQFIGHSLGTGVNAYASRIFLEEVQTVTKAQITILDYPNKIRQIPGVSLNSRFERLWGFDKDYFATVLPFDRENLTLRVDNYYGRHFLSAGAVGTSITAPIPIVNRELTNPHEVGDEFYSYWLKIDEVDNDHSGVHQWYRWTIRPKDDTNFVGTDVCINNVLTNLPSSINATLDPCQMGWNLSHVNPLALPFEGGRTNTPNASTTVAIELAGGVGNQCTINVGDGTIQCAENFTSADALRSYAVEAETIPPTVSYLDAIMTVPVNAHYITFDYRFTNVGDGDYVYLLVDDKPIWKMSGDATVQGEWQSSGDITIAMEPGENTFMVALYGVGEQNAQIEMKNFQFIEVLPTFADVPPAHTAYESVEALADAAISDGCNADGSLFCPDQALTRDTLALWLMKAKMGESYVPPTATGLFDDVPTTSPFADWIEAFSNEGFTEGCGTNLYCPNAPVTKAQLAKLLLITLNGTAYVPEAATGELFDDVGTASFNADWIEDAAKKGLFEGCGYRQFCPNQIMNRSTMARIVESVF